MRHPVRNVLFLAILAVVAVQPGAEGGPPPTAVAQADSHIMIVTSDSGDYCHTLSGAIAAYGALSREVRELKTQGDGLCDEGRIRIGIRRLRRALLVLMHKTTPGSQIPP